MSLLTDEDMKRSMESFFKQAELVKTYTQAEVNDLLKKQRQACAKAAHPFITSDGRIYERILNAEIDK